jgi:hypothetical protein
MKFIGLDIEDERIGIIVSDVLRCSIQRITLLAKLFFRAV